MNLAKIKRKKIPVQAGRSNVLPPLDMINEREKSAPVQGEGYGTTVAESKMSGKTMLAQKAATNPGSPPKSLKVDNVNHKTLAASPLKSPIKEVKSVTVEKPADDKQAPSRSSTLVQSTTPNAEKKVLTDVEIKQQIAEKNETIKYLTEFTKGKPDEKTLINDLNNFKKEVAELEILLKTAPKGEEKKLTQDEIRQQIKNNNDEIKFLTDYTKGKTKTDENKRDFEDLDKLQKENAELEKMLNDPKGGQANAAPSKQEPANQVTVQEKPVTSKEKSSTLSKEPDVKAPAKQ